MGEGTGNPFQYSCLENPIDRGARWATVHVVARVRHDLVTKPSPQPKIYQNLWDAKCVRIIDPPPNMHPSLSPEPVNMLLLMAKRTFADGTNLRILILVCKYFS